MEVLKYAYTENEYIYYYTNTGLRTEDDIVRAIKKRNAQREVCTNEIPKNVIR